MIIISGSGLKKTELPHHTTMSYVIEEDLGALNIKLKTSANASVCMAVFINVRLKDEVVYSDRVKEKLTFFKDDRELLSLLQSSNSTSGKQESVEPIVIEPVIEPVPDFKPEMPKEVIPAPTLEKTIVPKIEAEAPLINLVEYHLDEVPIEEDSDNEFLRLPNVLNNSSQEATALAKANQRILDIERKLRIKQSEVDNLQRDLDDSYFMQEQSIKELRNSYDGRLSDVISANKLLEQRVKDMEIPDNIRKFLKYASYVSQPRSLLNKGFYEDELVRYNKSKSKLHILANAGGTGVDVSGQYILNLLNGKESVVLVDFSNDLYLRHRLKVSSNKTSLKLGNSDVKVEEMAVKQGNSHYVASSLFHDITLLGMDWIEILNKVNAFADGRRVIFMFNSISSFAVKNTFSRLCTLGKGHLLAESKPSVLATLKMELKFFPPQSLNVVVFKYITEVQEMLQSFTKEFMLQAFDAITDWSLIWKDENK